MGSSHNTSHMHGRSRIPCRRCRRSILPHSFWSLLCQLSASEQFLGEGRRRGGAVVGKRGGGARGKTYDGRNTLPLVGQCITFWWMDMAKVFED